MKVDKAPNAHTVLNGWIQFSKDTDTEELYYGITLWNNIMSYFDVVEQGKVKDEAHLKELLTLREVEHGH